nr:histone-lysine N-methyltransferase ATX2-like [Tanacetum cinerariifolium]
MYQLTVFAGGAMKPTTDGRWANLACAMWILETCLSDIKKMEPVDGMSRISKKDFSKLLQSAASDYGTLALSISDIHWTDNFQEGHASTNPCGLSVM